MKDSFVFLFNHLEDILLVAEILTVILLIIKYRDMSERR